MQGKEPTQVKHISISTLKDMLLVLSTNIRLGLKWMQVSNNLAYYNYWQLKSFIVQAPGHFIYKIPFFLS